MRTWKRTGMRSGNNPLRSGERKKIMKLYDMDDGSVYTLPELFTSWKAFRKEEPWNHAENFRTEIFGILMATVNGRNNLEIIGMTAKETSGLINRIRRRI